MLMFYVSITLTIASSALYHFSQKSTPTDANPAVALLVTYAVAMLLTFCLLFFLPIRGSLLAEIGRLNWASYLLAAAIVGLEVGFLLVYRSGCCTSGIGLAL
jgi:hypothetical protein